jgi:protoporphyrin/coproporphyrin ferrochelatase
MKGILLVNLGSPKSPSTKDVKTYLDEFLMDECVIDTPWFFRTLLVKGIILNTRPKQSAKAYQSIWWDEGSPLVVISRRIEKKLQDIVDIPVALGMRYAEPSIEHALRELVNKGVTEVSMMPLYPQYAMSTTETVMIKAKEVQQKYFPQLKIHVVEPFYKDPRYIKILADSIRENLPEEFDVLQFSYHGVPERHILNTPPGQCELGNCCFEESRISHHFCYRHQCYKTTALVQEALGLPDEKIKQTFQSRLGRDPWLQPYTDKSLEEAPKQGLKKIAMVCPAFVSDCLETLEEISEEAKEIFEHAGGKAFSYIPCLNDDPRWVSLIKDLCMEKFPK